MVGYAIHQSPLYKVGSKKRLAAVLSVPLADLLLLARLGDENYREWLLPPKRSEELAGMAKPGSRVIQQPKILLATIQKRIATLLARIEKPDYVYSATKRRTYLHNALVHANAPVACKVDIKSFYTQVPARAVRSFFEGDLKCPPDIARILTALCTKSTHLPTGGAASPLLSFFACMAMFDSIAALARTHELNFSLYVDDMAFSGNVIPPVFIPLVNRELRVAGYRGHKICHYGVGQVKVITGVALGANGIAALTNRRRTKMRMFESAFWATEDPDHMRILGQALVGQYREADRVVPGSKYRAERIRSRMESVGPTLLAKYRGKPRRRLSGSRTRSSFAALRERLNAQKKI